jgi:hypothetical protein
MTEPEVRTDAHFSVPEHQILLSFNNDEDALLFLDWWNECGWKAFAKWAKPKENQA